MSKCLEYVNQNELIQGLFTFNKNGVEFYSDIIKYSPDKVSEAFNF
jgi:hypothetical protein